MRKAPAPRIARAGYTTLTGAELNAILDVLGVKKRQFARHIGRHEETVKDWTSGQSDGSIPLWIEYPLHVYDIETVRRQTDELPTLPLREWGIDRDYDPWPPGAKGSGRVRARNSTLTPDEFTIALEALGVTKMAFARHTGLHAGTVESKWQGYRDVAIPLWVDWVLYVYLIEPWYRRIPQRPRLPLKYWGIITTKPYQPERDPAVTLAGAAGP